jgi:hypothetical protein
MQALTEKRGATPPNAFTRGRKVTMTHPANEYTRRSFLTEGAAVAAGLLAMNAVGAVESNTRTAAAASSMPMIRLGGWEVSRLILGSNPFWGFWHGNPRKLKAYSQQGRKSVLDAAAAEGITAIWCPAYPEWIALWREYKENGGKLQTWMGQPDGYRNVTVADQIRACASNGGQAVCIQGENVRFSGRAGLNRRRPFPVCSERSGARTVSALASMIRHNWPKTPISCAN